MMFDLYELRRALILAGFGAAIVVGVFALLINAQQPMGVIRDGGPVQIAGSR